MKLIKGKAFTNAFFHEDNAVFSISFIILLGAAAAFFSVKYDALRFLSHAELRCVFPFLPVALLVLIAFCGFSAVGIPFALLLDFLFGASASSAAYFLLADAQLTLDWFAVSALLYFCTLSSLIISTCSCRLSRLLFDRAFADRKLKRRMVGYLAVSTFLILVIVSVLVLLYRFDSELLI